MSVFEVTRPADIGAPEPEVVRHVMPLAQWSRKYREAFHRNQKTYDAQRYETQRHENFDGGREIQRFGIRPEGQGRGAEAVNHTAKRTAHVSNEHRLRV